MALLKTYSIINDVAKGIVDHTLLESEIRSSSFVAGYQDIISNPDFVLIYGESLSDEAALDALILNHVAIDLDKYKSIKNQKIDIKTRELISQGFIYDSNIFSLSETAQRNWIGMDLTRLELTYPFSVSTKIDGKYTLQNAVEIHNFFMTGMGTAEYHYKGGRDLKQLINAATSEAEVDAVMDNR